MANQGDLFATNKLKKTKFDLPDADVTFYKSFFSPEDSNRLFKSLTKSIQWQQDQIKFYGKLIDLPRLTAWYGNSGFSYTYSGIPMNPCF